MRRYGTILLLVCSLLLAGHPVEVSLAVSGAKNTGIAPHRPGEVLVKLKGQSETFKIHVPVDSDVAQVAADYAKRAEVEYAEPNYLMQASAFDPNDVYYPEQWYLRQIAAPQAWEVTTGAPDVIVAVLDTGVDINHPDLRANIWTNAAEIPNNNLDDDGNGFVDDVHGWDFVDYSNDPRPDATPPYSRTSLNHGTVVAGVVGAVGNNIEGVAGVAWRTRLMPIRVLNSQGQGDVDQVAQAVDYATTNHATIINMSFVGSGYSQRLYDALRRAAQSGVIIIAAAGNTNESVNGQGDLDQNFLYPICYDAADVGNNGNWIIGVTATDTLDQRAGFGNFGKRCVDLSAPGASFFGTQVYDIANNLPDAYGGGWSGTSVAAPVVAGVAALVKAAQPTLTADQVSSVLLSSADNIDAGNRAYAGRLGTGRVNASRALTGAATPGKTPPREPTTFGGRIVTAPATVSNNEVKVFSSTGQVRSLWRPFGRTSPGATLAVSEERRRTPNGSSVRASALIRGEQHIIVGEGFGGQGRVQVFTTTGTPLSSWLAFDKPLRGGVSVAAGNVQAEGESAVVVVPLSGGGPLVRVFNEGGKVLHQFFAYDQKLRGGFSVTTADLDGNGVAEIIVSSTTLSLPIRVFSSSGKLLEQWQPYGAAQGTAVASADLDGDGQSEVLVSSTARPQPVLVLNRAGRELRRFFPLGTRFAGILSVAGGDLDGDGREEIVVSPLRGGGPQISVFDGAAKLVGQFLAYPRGYYGGVRLTVLR